VQQASHKKELLAKEAALQQHEWDHAIRYNNAIAQRERELAQHKKTAAQVTRAHREETGGSGRCICCGLMGLWLYVCEC
jgi:hypothetical protein